MFLLLDLLTATQDFGHSDSLFLSSVTFLTFLFFSDTAFSAVPDFKCTGNLAEVVSERQVIVNYGFSCIDIDFIACKWIIPVYLPVNPSVHEVPFLIFIIKHRGVPVVFPYKFQNCVGDMPGIAPVDYQNGAFELLSGNFCYNSRLAGFSPDDHTGGRYRRNSFV